MSFSSVPSGASSTTAARCVAHDQAVGAARWCSDSSWASLRAQARLRARAVLRAVVQAYVEAIRNTPFLVQLLLIYLGLPSIGIRLLPSEAALLAMVVNVGAYATEIVRAGIESVPRQIEAGRALGLKPWQIFRFIVLIPALRAVFPALGSQFILIMLASSVVSVISAEELTAVTDTIVARNFRSFEFYLVVTGMYLACRSAFQAIFALIDRWLFAPLEQARVIREFTIGEFWYPAPGGALDHRCWPSSPSSAVASSGCSSRSCAIASAAARRCAIAYIKIFQGTPLLMQLYLDLFRRQYVGPAGRSLVGRGPGAHALCQRLPRRDLARLHPGHSARPMGGRTRARAQLPAAASPRDPAAGAAHRDPADGRLPGAAAEGHVARLDHRLRRAHACRPGGQQRDLPAVHRLRPGRRDLLHLVLAALGLQPAARAATRSAPTGRSWRSPRRSSPPNRRAGWNTASSAAAD